MSTGDSLAGFTQALAAAMAMLGWRTEAGTGAGSSLPAVGMRRRVSISLHVVSGPSLRLTLDLGPAALAAGWLQMMGRAPTADEMPAMAGEVAAELLNQLAGKFAGELGKADMLVELATPMSAPVEPVSPWISLVREHAGERVSVFLSRAEPA